jgi:ferredoxin--NADP+ reductase
MAYRDVLQKLQERYGEQFRVISFVSRQDTDFAIKGRIPEAIEDGSLEKKVGLILSASQSQVMVCGNKAMVHDALQVLEKRGLKKSKYRDPGQITIESYI